MDDDFDDIYDEPDETDEPWHDDDEPPDDEMSELQALLAEYGIESVGQIIVEFENVPPEDLRGERFTEFIDAVHYLVDIGVIGFSDIVYFEDDGLYGVVIPDASDRAAA